MAVLKWRGDAQPRRQVDFLTPADVEIGDTFTATINRKDISFVATAATVANVVAGLVAAINANAQDIPEFDEVEASSGTDDDGNVTHVIITGPEDGKPFTLTASTTDAGEGEVTVTVLVEGVAPLNEIQRVRLGGTPTGGTFTLTFSGQTTGAIAYNANAAAVVAALEALSNIGVGDVAVTESATSDWLITFQGAFAETNVPILTGNGASITGAATVSVATTQAGGAISEIQDVTSNNGEPYQLTHGGYTSGFLNANMSAAQFQTALEAMPSFGSGNVLVSRSSTSTTVTFRVSWVGALIGNNYALMSFVSTPAGGVIAAVQDGTTQNEKQQVSLVGSPTGGTFTLTFQGQTTAGIAYNADTATLDAALEALSNIGVGDVTCTGGPLPGTAIVVEFTTALANTDVQQMTGSGTSLTGASVNVSVTQEAVTGVNEQQQVEIEGTPTGGTFTLTYSGQTTGTIAYNAAAGTVDTALEALSNIGAGDVTVTGSASGPWIIEFTAALAETNVSTMTADGAGLTYAGTQGLTRSSSVVPTGPNWVNDAENWSTGSNPVNGDTVIIEDSSVDILYGLDQLSAVTLAELRIESSFTGRIGLPDWTGLYYEYRPAYLAIGATLLNVGEGTGSGSPRLKINTGTVQTTITVLATASPEDAGLPAMLWKGTHASNAVRVYRGTFGAALLLDEVATILTLTQGYIDNQDGDSDVRIGSGVTLGTVVKSGGVLSVECAVATAFTQYVDAGVSEIKGLGAVAQLTILGGKVYYSTSGTLGGNTVVAVDRGLDFSRDLRAKTVTNPIESTVRNPVFDPFKLVGTLIIDFNQTEAGDLGIGQNVRITRGTPA